MKKILPLITVGFLILTGLGAAGIFDEYIENSEKIEKITFSKHPIIGNKGEYLTVSLEGADSLLVETGKPILPVYRKTFMFSSAAEIKMLQYFGADALGMSVVPDVLVARQLGMSVLAVSAITDQSLPEKMNKIEPGNVIREATGVIPDLSLLVSKTIKDINSKGK